MVRGWWWDVVVGLGGVLRGLGGFRRRGFLAWRHFGRLGAAGWLKTRIIEKVGGGWQKWLDGGGSGLGLLVGGWLKLPAAASSK